MRIFIFLIIQTFLSHSLQSQTLRVIVESDIEPLPFAEIDLINLRTGDTISKTSDLFGKAKFDDLNTAFYALEISCYEYEFDRVDSIEVKSNEESEITLEGRNCELEYPIHECPKCQVSKHVIRARAGIVVYQSFHKPKEEKRYFRRLAKKGYESTFYESAEFVYNIIDPGTNEKLQNSSICDQLSYCKKHRILY
ncbi:MAG: hypothetical protein AB8B56_16090 [Crocinitomicaceae bacterium]